MHVDVDNVDISVCAATTWPQQQLNNRKWENVVVTFHNLSVTTANQLTTVVVTINYSIT